VSPKDEAPGLSVQEIFKSCGVVCTINIQANNPGIRARIGKISVYGSVVSLWQLLNAGWFEDSGWFTVETEPVDSLFTPPEFACFAYCTHVAHGRYSSLDPRRKP
jgi:hypothetical protein